MSPEHAPGCPEYQALERSTSRRRFLAAGGLTLSALAAPAWLPRVSLASSYRSTQRDVLISIYLRGAADGLSMCVPYADPGYYANRTALAVPRPDTTDPNRCTDLNGFFGLPPSMLPLLPAYNDGHLLFVQASGSHDPSRSHFDAQRFMEVGKARDLTLGTGWLGRHLATTEPARANATLRGVGIAAGLQLTLAGGPETIPVPDLDKHGLSGASNTANARRDALTDLYANAWEPLATNALTTNATIDLLNLINFAGYTPSNGATYPTGSFSYALKTSAALIRADLGVEAIAIDLGGWDTHDAQGTIGGAMATLMDRLATGLAAFHKDIIAGPGPNVTIAVMSEFGRRVKENASLGTDHGHGGCMLLLGRSILGGRVLTQWPGLGPGQLWENLDLQVTTDYRDVLWEILAQRLGSNNLAAVFPGHTYAPKGILR